MNCCLKSGIHKHSPNSRVHVEVVHFVRGPSIVSPSHNRMYFLSMWEEDMQKLCSHFLLSASGFSEFSEILETASFSAPFVRNKLSCYFILMNAPRFRFRKFPQYLILLLRQVSPRFHPSTRQGKHLWASLDAASGLEFLLTLLAGFLKLWVAPRFWMQSDLSRMRNLSEHVKTSSSL